MPYKVVRDESKCSASKPWATINSSTGAVKGCHESREAAIKQLRALYVHVPEARSMDEQIPISYLIPVRQFAEKDHINWIDGNKLWIQVYPFDTWDHPQFGETTIDADIAGRMKANFDSGVRGIEIHTDYEHGMDPAKGTKASGKYVQLDVRDNGLWGLVQFTDTAKEEIEKGEWNYFSCEHWDTWTHPHSNTTFNYVISGGALTNKPWVKGMAPLNFSEVYVERAEPVGEVESTSNTPDGGTMGANDTSSEHRDMEHSEPGSGNPPDPAETDPDKEKDTKDRHNESGDIDTRLREALGLDKDADIIKAVTELHNEVKPIREAAKTHSERKAFAEMFPNEARELEESRKERQEVRAKQFTEQFLNLPDASGSPTGKGYPQVVLDKITEVHKKFSEGSANVNDFSDVLGLIAKTGTIEYGTQHGSSRVTDTTAIGSDGAKAFAEVIANIQDNDKVPYDAAVKIATERHPDLFQAYRETVRGRR